MTANIPSSFLIRNWSSTPENAYALPSRNIASNGQRSYRQSSSAMSSFKKHLPIDSQHRHNIRPANIRDLLAQLQEAWRHRHTLTIAGHSFSIFSLVTAGVGSLTTLALIVFTVSSQTGRRKVATVAAKDIENGLERAQQTIQDTLETASSKATNITEPSALESVIEDSSSVSSAGGSSSSGYASHVPATSAGQAASPVPTSSLKPPASPLPATSSGQAASPLPPSVSGKIQKSPVKPIDPEMMQKWNALVNKSRQNILDLKEYLERIQRRNELSQRYNFPLPSGENDYRAKLTEYGAFVSEPSSNNMIPFNPSNLQVSLDRLIKLQPSYVAYLNGQQIQNETALGRLEEQLEKHLSPHSGPVTSDKLQALQAFVNNNLDPILNKIIEYSRASWNVMINLVECEREKHAYTLNNDYQLVCNILSDKASKTIRTQLKAIRQQASNLYKDYRKINFYSLSFRDMEALYNLNHYLQDKLPEQIRTARSQCLPKERR